MSQTSMGKGLVVSPSGPMLNWELSSQETDDGDNRGKDDLPMAVEPVNNNNISGNDSDVTCYSPSIAGENSGVFVFKAYPTCETSPTTASGTRNVKTYPYDKDNILPEDTGIVNQVKSIAPWNLVVQCPDYQCTDDLLKDTVDMDLSINKLKHLNLTDVEKQTVGDSDANESDDCIEDILPLDISLNEEFMEEMLNVAAENGVWSNEFARNILDESTNFNQSSENSSGNSNSIKLKLTRSKSQERTDEWISKIISEIENQASDPVNVQAEMPAAIEDTVQTPLVNSNPVCIGQESETGANVCQSTEVPSTVPVERQRLCKRKLENVREPMQDPITVDSCTSAANSKPVYVGRQSTKVPSKVALQCQQLCKRKMESVHNSPDFIESSSARPSATQSAECPAALISKKKSKSVKGPSTGNRGILLRKRKKRTTFRKYVTFSPSIADNHGERIDDRSNEAYLQSQQKIRLNQFRRRLQDIREQVYCSVTGEEEIISKLEACKLSREVEKLGMDMVDIYCSLKNKANHRREINEVQQVCDTLEMQLRKIIDLYSNEENQSEEESGSSTAESCGSDDEEIQHPDDVPGFGRQDLKNQNDIPSSAEQSSEEMENPLKQNGAPEDSDHDTIHSSCAASDASESVGSSRSSDTLVESPSVKPNPDSYPEYVDPSFLPLQTSYHAPVPSPKSTLSQSPRNSPSDKIASPVLGRSPVPRKKRNKASAKRNLIKSGNFESTDVKQIGTNSQPKQTVYISASECTNESTVSIADQGISDDVSNNSRCLLPQSRIPIPSMQIVRTEESSKLELFDLNQNGISSTSHTINFSNPLDVNSNRPNSPVSQSSVLYQPPHLQKEAEVNSSNLMHHHNEDYIPNLNLPQAETEYVQDSYVERTYKGQGAIPKRPILETQTQTEAPESETAKSDMSTQTSQPEYKLYSEEATDQAEDSLLNAIPVTRSGVYVSDRIYYLKYLRLPEEYEYTANTPELELFLRDIDAPWPGDWLHDLENW